MKSKDLQKEGFMNLKNLGRLFVFVFVLFFVSLCQSETTPAEQARWEIDDIDWVIPQSIKDAYPLDPVEKDWQDLQRDLLAEINRLNSDIEHYKNKPFQVAKVLARQRVWLKKIDEKVVSGIGPIRGYLATELAGQSQRIGIESIPKIEWFHFPEDKEDIFAEVSFKYKILSTNTKSDHQTLDPEGGGEYGHRKICTWF
jgi:hypothetical protein